MLWTSATKWLKTMSNFRALFRNFKHLFQKFELYLAVFLECFERFLAFVPAQTCLVDPSDRDHLSQQRADGSFPCIVPAEESEDAKLEEVLVVRYFLSLVAYLTLRRKSLHSSNAIGWVLCRIGKERTTTQKRPICAFCDSARVGLRTLRTFCL